MTKPINGSPRPIKKEKASVDATVEQVRRLVAKLKEKETQTPKPTSK